MSGPSSGSTRPKYRPCGNATTLPAKRSPPTCVLSHVASGNAAASAPRRGARARRSRGPDGRGCRRRRAGRSSPAGNAPRSRGSRRRRVVDPVEDRGSAPRVARVDTARRGSGRRGTPELDPACGSAGPGHRSCDSRARRSRPRPSGSRASSEPVAAPRPRMLDQQPVADRGRRARERLPGRQAPQRAAIVDRGHGRLSDRRGS